MAKNIKKIAEILGAKMVAEVPDTGGGAFGAYRLGEIVAHLQDRPPAKFSPSAYYDPAGDCIEFLASPESFYAERVDDLVTVYHSQETDEIIGSLLKGVSPLCKNLLERLPGFKIEIQHGRIKLVHIFLAKLWASEANPDKLATVTYQKLIDVAGKTGVEVELQKAA